MRASIKRLLPNLQLTVVDGQKVKACTRCMRTAVKPSRATVKASK